MKAWLALGMVVGLVPAVQAQTHPCDQPPLATQTIASGAPHRLQWCSLASDQIEALIAIIDGTPVDLLAVTAKTGASATGWVLYESPLFLQVARGTHVLTAAVYNRNQLTGALQVGPPSDPFSFSAVDDTPAPVGPVVHGLSR